MRGGKRKGAGRKRGVKTIPYVTNAALRERILKSGISPLEFLIGLMRAPMPEREQGESILAFNKRLELWATDRKTAAKEAAPYLHPKLSATEVTGEDGGPIQHQHRMEIEFVTPARKK